MESRRLPRSKSSGGGGGVVTASRRKEETATRGGLTSLRRVVGYCASAGEFVSNSLGLGARIRWADGSVPLGPRARIFIRAVSEISHPCSFFM